MQVVLQLLKSLLSAIGESDQKNYEFMTWDLDTDSNWRFDSEELHIFCIEIFELAQIID